MKTIVLIFSMLLLGNMSTMAQKEKGKKKKKDKNKTEMKLETTLDSVSYGIGINIAENLKGQGLDSLNVDALAKGMVDYLNNSDLAISKEAVMPMLNEYMKNLQEEQVKKSTEEGTKFLAENAKREGVTVLPSGLQYEVIASGNGESPSATDTVTTHYTGTLLDGSVFDSSVERGEPTSFPVNRVIPGWTEALQLMKTGDKWKLYIPYNLAYGPRGNGAVIPAYATLIFEIELISIGG